MADTAALVVALSAQLTKFEKDMGQAVAIADRKTKEIETTFTRMNVAVNNQLSNVALASAGRLGAVGNILTALGPVGLTVAASIGTLALAFSSISEKVDKFADKARALKEFSETVGITTEALKALNVTAQQVGLDSEQTERGITKLAIAVQDLRTKGSGPLFDILLKINPALITQVAAAKDVTEAIDILSAAYKNLAQSQQFQLSTALGGRRNVAIGRILGALPEGGLTQAAQQQLDKGFSPELIERVAKLRQEIEAIQKRTENIWGQTFSVGVLSAQKQSAEFWLQIAESVERAAKNVPGASSFWDSVSRGAQKALDAGRGPVPSSRAAPVTPVEQGGALPGLDVVAAAAAQERERQIGVLKNEIEIMKSWTTAVGDALTQEEALLLKEKEAKLGALENVKVREQGTRGLDAFTLAQRQTTEALRERLGIATEEQIVEGKLEKLRADAIRDGLTANEVLRATNVIMKEAKETADQMAIRQAYFPGLKQLELDAQNVKKGFDQLAVRTFDTLGDGFADIILKTKSLSDAFKSMTDSILRDLLRLLFRQAVTGPIAGLLQPGGAGIGSLFFGGGSPSGYGRQAGGPVSAGRSYVVGEHGPELFVPQSAGHVMPNAISGGKGAGGTSVEINNYVAADTETKQTRQEGPTGDRIIIDIVKKAQARGDLDDVNRGRFGLRPAKVR